MNGEPSIKDQLDALVKKAEHWTYAAKDDWLKDGANEEKHRAWNNACRIYTRLYICQQELRDVG